jgi:hypothetical protein
LTPNELRGLAGKYREMAELRRAGAPDETGEERARLRRLASAFPGALRELDSLPTDEIDRRAQVLEAAAEGAPVEPWMAWLHGFHTLMRAGLAVRLALADGKSPDEVAAMHGVERSFVDAMRAPPHGRMMVVVFDRLAARHNVPAKTIWDTLFPPRRGERSYRNR